MAIAALLLTVAFFIAFIIGLIKPSIVLGKSDPKRSKLFLRFLLPSMVLFGITGYLTNKEYDANWKNPEGVTRLVLTDKDFNELPDRLKEFQDLEDLSLKNNQIQFLDEEILKSIPNLKSINLENNPISELPLWLKDLGLETLDLGGTQIVEIPGEIRNAITNINYEDTPLALTENKELEILKDSVSGYPETESLGDFAVRKLLGKEYGYEKQFKQGTLYYTKGVAEAKVDSLGSFLIRNGYFTDDKEVSMQIRYNEQTGIKAYELRAVYGPEEPLEAELYPIFDLLALMVSEGVFDGMPTHFHLTDNEFNKTKYIFKSGQSTSPSE